MKLRSLFAALIALAWFAVPAKAQTPPFGSGATRVALFCLNSAGTAWIPSGGAAGACLGSGGSGGGAVTAILGAFVDGALVTLGLKADAASAAVGSTGMSVMRQIDADINTLNTTAGNPLAPGTAMIGYVTQAPIAWTQTIVTLSAATSATLIAANASRKKLRWMVTGTNPMTVAPGAVTVVVNVGMNYNGNSGVGTQGGSDTFDGDASQQAFSAISTLGTTLTVWEGK